MSKLVALTGICELLLHKNVWPEVKGTNDAAALVRVVRCLASFAAALS